MIITFGLGSVWRFKQQRAMTVWRFGEKWSRQSDNFQEGECGKKWRGFNDEGRITRKTLYWYAIQGGYKPAGGRPMTDGGTTLPTLDRIVRVGAGAELMWELTTGDTTVRVSQAELTTSKRDFRNGVARCIRGKWST